MTWMHIAGTWRQPVLVRLARRRPPGQPSLNARMISFEQIRALTDRATISSLKRSQMNAPPVSTIECISLLEAQLVHISCVCRMSYRQKAAQIPSGFDALQNRSHTD